MGVLRLRFRDKIFEVGVEKAKRGGIRWAVGTQDGLRSSTWRLWGDNKKGDVHISRRGSDDKVSFHRDEEAAVQIASRRGGFLAADPKPGML